MSGRKVRVRLVAMGCVMALLIASVPPQTLGHHDGTQLWGSNFGNFCDTTPLSQCVANDANHFYALIDLSAQRQGATQRALSNLYGANSEINVFTSSSSDLKVYEVNSAVNAFAFGQCAPVGAVYGGNEAAHTRWCQPQYIKWNTAVDAASKVNTTAKYNYIGCHEVGHTVGLRHRPGSTSCMLPAPLPPSNPAAVVPSEQNPLASDYTRLNAHYPIP